MKKWSKSALLTVLGMVLCTVPAMVGVLQYFPLWMDSKEKSICFFTVVLLLISCIPLWKYLREMLKSPSAWQLYLIIGGLFYVIDSIAGDVAKIFLFATPFSVVGAFLFRLAKKVKER